MYQLKLERVASRRLMNEHSYFDDPSYEGESGNISLCAGAIADLFAVNRAKRITLCASLRKPKDAEYYNARINDETGVLEVQIWGIWEEVWIPWEISEELDRLVDDDFSKPLYIWCYAYA
jgi:hypothetical protein